MTEVSIYVRSIERALCRVSPGRAARDRGRDRGTEAGDPRLGDRSSGRASLAWSECYPFPDFAQALAFTQKVGELAEEERHHPALLTEWGRVTVAWWTHKIRGLHRNDFIMAAKTDRLRSKVPEP